MDERPAAQGVFAFSYKTFWNHVRDFAGSPLPILARAVAVFGGLWTFGEATIQFTAVNPRGWLSYGFLVAASVVTALAWSIYQYLHRVPEGFEGVPKAAQRIAHLQRPLWEFRLAKSLLAHKLAPLERELTDMEAGRHFVIAEKPADLQTYLRWGDARIGNILAMLAVSKQLILKDFPAALQSTPEQPADPIAILTVVESLARFYGETVAFERSVRAVTPSDDLTDFHRLQFGWTAPIRDAVRQLFKFLQRMCECDLHEDNNISFEIVLAEPEGMSQFCQELDRLQPSFREIERNW